MRPMIEVGTKCRFWAPTIFRHIIVKLAWRTVAIVDQQMLVIIISTSSHSTTVKNKTKQKKEHNKITLNIYWSYSDIIKILFPLMHKTINMVVHNALQQRSSEKEKKRETKTKKKKNTGIWLSVCIWKWKLTANIPVVLKKN